MNYKHLIPSILGALLLGAALFFSLPHQVTPRATENTATSTVATSTDPRTPAPLTTTVASKKTAPTVIRIPVVSPRTAMDAMAAYAATGAMTYTTEQYPSLGRMVTSINGLKNDTTHYWFLYINGQSSSLGASTVKVGPADTVEWRYEKSY